MESIVENANFEQKILLETLSFIKKRKIVYGTTHGCRQIPTTCILPTTISVF